MRRRLLLAVPLAIALTASAGRTQGRPITLLVPAFEGPQSLGVNVATILNLQVWQTLRKAPYPNPGKVDFGNGMVTWIDKPLAPQTHETAAGAAKNNAADLVLWGKAARYGAGVVAQSYLTIVPRRDPLWRTSLRSGGSWWDGTSSWCTPDPCRSTPHCGRPTCRVAPVRGSTAQRH